MREGGLFEYFREWALGLVLDTGETWKLEDWRRNVATEGGAGPAIAGSGSR